MADQPQSDAEYIASLTPERAEEVAGKITEQWQRDWGAVMEKVIEKTGLSRSEAFQFMLLRETAAMRDQLLRNAKPIFHENCKACQQEREFHEAQFEHMKLANRHLKEEHGEDWQQ